jgi:hypothetical protein
MATAVTLRTPAVVTLAAATRAVGPHSFSAAAMHAEFAQTLASGHSSPLGSAPASQQDSWLRSSRSRQPAISARATPVPGGLIEAGVLRPPSYLEGGNEGGGFFVAMSSRCRRASRVRAHLQHFLVVSGC